MAGYMALFRAEQGETSRTGIEQTNLRPPEPRLEPDPEGDARVINGKADSNIDGYGWVDRTHGIARIPIGQAMQLLAQHGWPSKQESRP
jgi:hypothetical protein